MLSVAVIDYIQLQILHARCRYQNNWLRLKTLACWSASGRATILDFLPLGSKRSVIFALSPRSVGMHLGNMLTFCFGNIICICHCIERVLLPCALCTQLESAVECVICIQYRFCQKSNICNNANASNTLHPGPSIALLVDMPLHSAYLKYWLQVGGRPLVVLQVCIADLDQTMLHM